MRADADVQGVRPLRGRLRVYLGAAPGVGKTWTMLQDARRRADEGIDVVTACVDTHRMMEATALADGFESVPPRSHAGAAADEPDLNVVDIIRRGPQLVLIDDLAHRNAKGSRNLTRWQDIDELRNAGMDVYSTLNLHALQSLAPTIQELTRIRFPHTIEPAVFDAIDEICVVDTPPQDLLDRLQRGQVHLERPGRMLQDYFRVETLSALRELALRQAVEHAQCQRQRRPIGPGADDWPVTRTVLVYVDANATAQPLIGAAKRVADSLRAELIVACHEAGWTASLHSAARPHVHETIDCARRVGAAIVMLANAGRGRQLIEVAQRKNVELVVLASPARTAWQRWRDHSIRRTLQTLAPELDLLVLSAEHSKRARTWDSFQETRGRDPVERPTAGPLRKSSFLWAALLTVAATLASFAVAHNAEPSNPLLLYLVGVVFIAYRFGFWPSTVAAVLSVGASDYLFIRPYYSFAIARSQDFGTLCIFLVAALVVSRLTVGLRYQNERSQQRERRIGFLYELTNALSGLRSAQSVAALAQEQIHREFAMACRVVPVDPQGQVSPAAGVADPVQSPGEPAAAQAALDRRVPAGRGTDLVPEARHLYLPIVSPEHRLAILIVQDADLYRSLPAEQRLLLDTVVGQVGQAMERIALAEAARKATVEVELQALRNSLLSSIAHDFRTPLASIVAASGALLADDGVLSEAHLTELKKTILDESQRMARLASNTLELARAEAGTVALRREWYPIEETVGAVISRMQDRLKSHVILTHLPPGIPLAHVDVVSIVQVLENLIENAVKYTAPGLRIEIGAELQADGVRFWVRDDGPGVTPGEEEKIFEKFYRGAAAGKMPGVGLGLAICKAIVQAHGGHIAVRNLSPAGAEFSFSIVHADKPPEFIPEDEPLHSA